MAEKKAIISRHFDFWCLGGLSILFWGILWWLQWNHEPKTANTSFSPNFLIFSTFSSVLTLLCNQPHFISSYLFCYRKEKEFILKHKFCLIWVPSTLLCSFIFAYWHPVLMSYAVLLMNLTIGWHYSKQIFGCILTYARYDKYELSQGQKTVLKWNLFFVAILNFISNTQYFSNLDKSSKVFLGVPLIDFSIPSCFYTFSSILVGISTLCVVVFILWKNFNSQGKNLPSLNFLIPWIAFFVWWLPVLRQREFYFLFVPFFHGLQYFPFALNRERSFKPEKSLNRSIILWITLGILWFQFLPKILDVCLSTENSFGFVFFLSSIGIFINVHHFFIDSVIWKTNDPEVKKALG